MALLLDTHILLWAMDTPQRLSADVQEMLANRSQEVYFSCGVGAGVGKRPTDYFLP